MFDFIFSQLLRQFGKTNNLSALVMQSSNDNTCIKNSSILSNSRPGVFHPSFPCCLFQETLRWEFIALLRKVLTLIKQSGFDAISFSSGDLFAFTRPKTKMELCTKNYQNSNFT
ncbi:hypothetical protein BUE76_22180 [Cnuella takakiae]|nr:hypothetical protein BUE76_22180 [Cnuella takakiae]